MATYAQVIGESLLRRAEVKTQTGLARLTIYKIRAEDKFPTTAQLSACCVAFRASEVDDWIASRASVFVPTVA